MKSKFLSLLFVSILVSCKETTQPEPQHTNGFTPILKTKEDSLFHDVMEGHDIGMARMGKISKYLTRIQSTLDSLNKLPAARVDANYKQSIINLQEDLKYAEYGMNTWMEGFKVDSAKDDKEKRIQYLESEKVKIQKVKEAILESLGKADSVFAK